MADPKPTETPTPTTSSSTSSTTTIAEASTSTLPQSDSAVSAQEVAAALMALDDENKAISAAVRKGADAKKTALDLIAKYRLTPNGRKTAVAINGGNLVRGGTLGYQVEK